MKIANCLLHVFKFFFLLSLYQMKLKQHVFNRSQSFSIVHNCVYLIVILYWYMIFWWLWARLLTIFDRIIAAIFTSIALSLGLFYVLDFYDDCWMDYHKIALKSYGNFSDRYLFEASIHFFIPSSMVSDFLCRIFQKQRLISASHNWIFHVTWHFMCHKHQSSVFGSDVVF